MHRRCPVADALAGADPGQSRDTAFNGKAAELTAVVEDDEPFLDYIETLHKRGYRFVGEVAREPASPERGPARRPRLVVLPFLNLSGDPAQEYFSDAVTDEIITEIASVAPNHLAVIARTSSMHYKNSRKDVARISRELDVDTADARARAGTSHRAPGARADLRADGQIR
jgi:hypothetical protein